MRGSLFEYCAKIDGREMWIEVSELAISHWYDRSGALEAIPDTLDLEKRVFLEFVFGVEDSRSARRLARGRDNFTISVELPTAVFSCIRQLAKLSAKTGMTANDEAQLNTLLEPVFREEVQEFLPDLVLR